MTLVNQAREGVRKALEIKDLSPWKASKNAGLNQNQCMRFLNAKNDITFKTYEKLCEEGIGMPAHVVMELGRW